MSTTMNHIYEIEGSFSFRGRLDASNISAAVLVREAERTRAIVTGKHRDWETS